MRRAFACAATGLVLAGSSSARADRVLTPPTVNARMHSCLVKAGAARVALHRRAATGDAWFVTPRPSPLLGGPIAMDREHAGWSIVYETKHPHDVVGILSTDDGLASADGAAFMRCTNAALR